MIFQDFLYGKLDGSDLKESVKDQEYLNILGGYQKSDWLEVLKKYTDSLLHVTTSFADDDVLDGISILHM